MREINWLERVRFRFMAYMVGEEFDEFFALDDVMANVVAALAHRQGWHQHHRVWRRKRGADVTVAEQALKILKRMDNRIKPLLAPA